MADDPLSAVLGLLPSLLSAGTSIFGTLYNAKQERQTNELNRAYATEMTERQWSRDDNSLQRQVNDALAAHLSPLAVTGAMNSSAPLAYQAQPSQLDFSGLIGSLASASSVLDRQADRTLKREEDSEQTRQFEETFKETSRQFEAQLKQQDTQFTASQVSTFKQFNATMSYSYKVLNAEQKSADKERYVKISEQSLSLYREICSSLGFSPKVETVSDYETYKTKLTQFMTVYDSAMSSFIGKHDSISTSNSYSVNDSTAVNGGVTVAGTGANVGTNIGSGESGSASVTYDNTRSNNAEAFDVLKNVSFPLYRPLNSDYVNETYQEITY